MSRDRDQLTPDDPEDRRQLESNRGQGTAGTGFDLLPEADDPGAWLEVTSTAFDDGDLLPDRFARQDGNTVPPLEWSPPPEDAAEVVVLCEDPDAPSGTFTHWLVAGIDPGETSVEEGGDPPAAVVGRNGFGEMGWGGPQPPPGDEPHRYFFTVVAVDEPLDLEPGFDSSDLASAVAGHAVAAGQVMGRYAR